MRFIENKRHVGRSGVHIRQEPGRGQLQLHLGQYRTRRKFVAWEVV